MLFLIVVQGMSPPIPLQVCTLTSPRLWPHFRQKIESSAYTLPQAGQLAICQRLMAWGSEFRVVGSRL